MTVQTRPARIDVHQHLWPPALVEALRSRRRAPMLRGWTLHLDGEPPYEVRPEDHTPSARAALEPEGALALVSLSSPLGLEDLPPAEAEPLLASWHAGAAELPAGFGAWAAVRRLDPDLAALESLLTGGFVGLQVPATWLRSPAELERLAPVLAVCERANRPLLVHPGAVAPTGAKGSSGTADSLPGWWPAVVDYPAQLQAAWWSWHQAGRALLPELRIAFVAAAGLAPLQHERFAARAGRSVPVDPGVFVETSSYGPQVVGALVRALGPGQVVRGSDRPYAEPGDLGLEPAVTRAVDVLNPQSLVHGGPSHPGE